MKIDVKLSGPLFSEQGRKKLVADLKNDAVARATAELRAKIESLTCPVHNQHPSVEITMSPDGDADIRVTACCEQFIAQVGTLLK